MSIKNAKKSDDSILFENNVRFSVPTNTKTNPPFNIVTPAHVRIEEIFSEISCI